MKLTSCCICGAAPGTENGKYCGRHKRGRMLQEVADGINRGLSNREIAGEIRRRVCTVIGWAEDARKVGLVTVPDRRKTRYQRARP